MKKLIALAIVLMVMGCKKSEPGPPAPSPAGETQSQAAGAEATPGLAPMPTLPLSQALTDKSVKEVSYQPLEALRGLKGVSVTLWGFVSPEARNAGLDLEALKQECEDKLRAAGVPVQPFEDVAQNPEFAYLFLKMDVRPQGNPPVLVGSINLSAFQFVYLGRNPALVVKSETWATHKQPFLSDEPSVKEAARQMALDELQTFIQDYQAGNPSVSTP